MVRACHDLRPEGIVWPRRADADRPSFRLEELTLANGITHEQVHEVLSTPPTQHYLHRRRHKTRHKRQCDAAGTIAAVSAL